MPPTTPDSDWKAFRALRERALERFCREALVEISDLCQDSSRSHHDRYISVFQWLEQRNTEMSRAFDNPRRSTMDLQLLTIVRLGLIERDELKQFSPARRQSAESFFDDPVE